MQVEQSKTDTCPKKKGNQKHLNNMDRNTRNIINKAQTKISSLKELTGQDRSKKFNIPFLLDELDAATFKGNSLSTSSSLADDEIEACLGSLAGKINLILEALRKMGVVK